MIEGHDFVTAYFTNNEKTIVETVWWSPDEETYRTFVLEVDDEDPRWNELLEKYFDIDQLHEATYNHIKQQREGFEQDILTIAHEENELENILSGGGDGKQYILDGITKAYDDEELFKFKLLMFEQKHIMESTDRDLKARLRKAKTTKEVFSEYLKF